MKLIAFFLLLSGISPTAYLPGNSSFNLYGTITDAETDEPVSFAYVHLEELNRTAVADAEGHYQLSNIPAGEYTLSVHRIGYRTQSQKVIIEESDKLLDIQLTASVLGSQSVEVVGTDGNLDGSNLAHASKKVLGSDLRRNLGSTLSQTLSNLPGFDERSMGSAPGRPVIRGLGDERVLILQDGMRSGDVSDQSSDHAVTIDPISAQEVEILRGPAALAYGANAIAGVINIVRNQIKTSVPARTTGNFTLNGESVNTGVSGALDVTIPYKKFAVNLNLNGRTASDTQTPVGKIENTDYSSTNNAIGISHIKDWGYIGGAFSTYFNKYGIPPEPNGHEHGVDIEMRKFQYDLKSELVLNNNFLKVIESDLSLKNYFHHEIEAGGGSGTEFGIVTTNFSLKTTHKPIGFLNDGLIGFWSEIEDYAVRNAGTPDANSYKVGTYLIEEADFGNLHLEGGLRYDWVLNKPKINEPDSPIGSIRERSFNALSSSVAAIFSFGDGFSAGSSLLHSFRAPSLEELYSEGPHLASYSYEIGNPELEPERALAKEIFVRYQHKKASAEAAVFHNKFSNYLYAQDTGTPSNSHPDLNNYRFVGTEARLYGFEISAEAQLLNYFVIKSSVSYTIGEREVSSQEQTEFADDVRPLPQIPPLKSKTSLRYINDGFEIGSRIRFAATQSRTGEFETKTDGYILLDAFMQYRFNKTNLMHTFSLNINNVLDEEYYNHLSRIKELSPEPGFNISLLYRVYF